MTEITIQLTESCNLSCPYCFAGKKSGAEISADDLNFFIEFCRKNKIESVHITGGEPMIFGNFKNCIENLAEIAYLVIYSNFTVQDMIKKLNLRDGDLIFLVNINPRETYTAQQWKNLIDNIDAAKEKNIRLAFGRTFYRETIAQDFKNIVDMNKEYGIKLLRLSPAISNNALNLNQVRELFSLVAAEFESLQKSGVKCYFDCPFPACIIGEKIYKKLREGLIISTHCAPKLFVTYNLKVRQCYIELQNLPARSLRTFKDYDAVKNYSAQRLNSILRPKFSKCANCVHSKFLWGCACPLESEA